RYDQSVHRRRDHSAVWRSDLRGRRVHARRDPRARRGAWDRTRVSHASSANRHSASEALALRCSDVDLEAKAVTIRRALSRWKLPKALAGDEPQERFRIKGTKRKSSVRTIPLTPETVMELKKWKLACSPTSEGWVFPSDDGEPARKDTVLQSWFYPAAENAGLRKFNLKALRQSYASALIYK